MDWSEGVGWIIERGESFDGYRVERVLGRGGMGVVYEAVQLSLDRRVALKVLRSDIARDPVFVERFRREAKLQASIEHPHVLDVYEVAEPEPGELLLSMRLVEGGTLADLISSGELTGERALALLEQAAAALDAAHAAGLVHRDLKPQNILVDRDDDAFLADFGLSRMSAEATASTRAMLGTVAYVAPETVHGEEPGAAADLYAFAATTFQCLTGDVVFPRGTDAAVLYAHATEEPPSISERRPELPAKLDPVFDDALAKDPARRPRSATAFVAEIGRTIGADRLAEMGAPDPTRRPGITPATVPTPATLPGPPRAEAPAGAPRRLSWAAVALLVVALSGALAASLIGGPSNGDSAPDVPLPPVASGAQPLGSSLDEPEMSLTCRGDDDREGARPRPCSIVQTALPDAQLLVPTDGTIVGWTVVGASGDISLDVIRPRGDDTVRVAKSQWGTANNESPTRFAANLPVERGDVLGLQMGPDAKIGVRATEGATTDRWLDVLGGFYSAPDLGEGTGFDYELMFRADFVPGGEQRTPRELTGRAAAEAPDGNVRRRIDVEISKPPATAPIELVEVGDRVALDLLDDDGTRISRMLVPGLIPGSLVLSLRFFTYEGEDSAEVGLIWANPNSGRTIYHNFSVSESHIEFLG